MDIEALIQREAPGDSLVNQYYAEALRNAYGVYQGKSRRELLDIQASARLLRDLLPSHKSTARLVVISELLKE